MKVIKIKTIVVLTLLFQMTSCMDLNELNISPNSPVDVSSNYILTNVLSGTAKLYNNLGEPYSSVSGVMQYYQMGTNEAASSVNQYLWPRGSWSEYYENLRNVKIINEKSKTENNKFFEAISLVLRAFIYGTITDLFGDAPYSESLLASEGIYFPKYDEQKYIYKGILEDLKKSSQILADPGISAYKIDANADILYKGNPDKWLKFANSLRLRYCMRVFNKKDEMSKLGIDIVSEFNNASAYAFTSNDDEAFVSYLGIAAENSAPGGPLNEANPNLRTKPCRTIVDTLISRNDPRLQRWVMPVQRKWDYKVTSIVDKSVKTIFGEIYTIKYIPTTNQVIDTSLWVGLPQNMNVIDLLSYNKGDDIAAYHPERSPYISFLHPRYRENNGTYIRMDLMMDSEVEFLLAEAAQKAIFSVTGAEDHYKKGIIASMKRWGIVDGTGGFNFNAYYDNPKVSYNSASNKLERIIDQKWVSLWLEVESWFDWRRTGYPVLITGPVTQYGPAMPLRFMYPLPNPDAKYLVNYDEAVNRLETTSYVPAGQSKDHTYSKMWLLQGTNKP